MSLKKLAITVLLMLTLMAGCTYRMQVRDEAGVVHVYECDLLGVAGGDYQTFSDWPCRCLGVKGP